MTPEHYATSVYALGRPLYIMFYSSVQIQSVSRVIDYVIRPYVPQFEARNKSC